MSTFPSCSPFSQAITTEFLYRGNLFRATALPTGEEIACNRLWEVYLSSQGLSTYFTMTQARRTPHNPSTVQQRAIAFIADGRFFDLTANAG